MVSGSIAASACATVLAAILANIATSSCYMKQEGSGGEHSARRMRTSGVTGVPTGWQGDLDEAFLTMNGARPYRWRVAGQDDNALDMLVQSRRSKKAAKTFLHKLPKG